MIEKRVPLNIPPGIYRSGTDYQAGGRWFDGNLVRFFEKTIRPVGGWRRAPDENGDNLAAVSGVPRAMLAWRIDAGDSRVAIGTTEKLMLLAGGELFDITPTGFTTGREDSGLAAGGGTFGNGAFGVGPYGVGSTVATLAPADTWQLDNFGDFLVGVSTSDRTLYVWEGNPANAAVEEATAPAGIRAVVVTPERFVFVLGAGGNSRLVQWPARETTDEWTPLVTNDAGDFELATNGNLVCGRRGQNQTLLWTDVDLWAATYIGGVFVYRFDQRGDNCGIISPNAVAMDGGVAYWMGRRAFFRYDGYVQPIPSEVADYVFGDFNDTQRAKVWALPVPEFGEVWWFYPSAASTEIDRYVVYNHRENHWSIGRLSRTAGSPAGAIAYPMMTDANGLVYEHEYGDDREGEVFLESGPVQLAEGDQVMKIRRVVPDEKTLGDVSVVLKTSMDPTTTPIAHGPFSLAQPTAVRLTARLVRVRFVEAVERNWRIGRMVLGLLPGGRR